MASIDEMKATAKKYDPDGSKAKRIRDDIEARRQKREGVAKTPPTDAHKPGEQPKPEVPTP